jgi:hypothetical protein
MKVHSPETIFGHPNALNEVLIKPKPGAGIYQKSHILKKFHADSIVIVDKENVYQCIILVLVAHPKDGDILVRLAAVVDETVDRMHKASK